MTNPRLAFVALLAPAELVYLALVLHTGDHAHLGMSLLFLGAVALLVWERPVAAARPALTSRIAGGLMLAGMIAACAWLWGQGLDTTEKHPLRLLPLAALVGVVLMVEGVQGLPRRWREGLVLFFLGGPHLLAWWIELPNVLAEWGARSAGYLLWYGGRTVAVQGSAIALPGGAIRVTPECAGSDILTYLLGLGVVAMLLFPLRPPRPVLVLVTAAAIGYWINVVRLMWLALLSGPGDRAAFDYWHTSEGSQLFGVSAILLFILFYGFLLRPPRPMGE